jgi:hypothetical protein
VDLPAIPDFEPERWPELETFAEGLFGSAAGNGLDFSALFVPELRLDAVLPELPPLTAAMLDLLDELLGLVAHDDDDVEARMSFIWMANAVRSLRPELTRQLAKVDEAKIREMVLAINDRVQHLLEL